MHQYGPFKEKAVCEEIAKWVHDADWHANDQFNAPKLSPCWEG